MARTPPPSPSLPPPSLPPPSPAPLSSTTLDNAGNIAGDNDELLEDMIPSRRRRHWLLFCVLAAANLCSAVAFSCVVPFFPGQAKAKGLSTSEVGLLIGWFQLGSAIASILLGRSMAQLGASRVFSAGLFLCAVAFLLFGALPLLPSSSTFFWFSMVLRSLMATGYAAYKTSQMAIVAQAFPAKLAFTMGLLDTFSGISYSLGGLIGALLFRFGGFALPFCVFGCVMLLSSLLSIWLLTDSPSTNRRRNQRQRQISSFSTHQNGYDHRDTGDVDTQQNMPSAEQLKTSNGLLPLLRVPQLWLSLLGLAFAQPCFFFYDALLAEHVAEWDTGGRSAMLPSLLISLTAAFAMPSAPLWGLLVDRSGGRLAEPVMLFGCILAALFALFLGPSPLLPFLHQSVPLLIFSFALLQGIGITAVSVPRFKYCLRLAKQRGLDDRAPNICGFLSGLVQGCTSLGAFLGNWLGGSSAQWIGLPWTGTLAAALQIPFALGFIGLYAFDWVKQCSCAQAAEMEPLEPARRRRRRSDGSNSKFG